MQYKPVYTFIRTYIHTNTYTCMHTHTYTSIHTYAHCSGVDSRIHIEIRNIHHIHTRILHTPIRTHIHTKSVVQRINIHSVAYHGNAVTLWEYLASLPESVAHLGSDQTSCHNAYGGGCVVSVVMLCLCCCCYCCFCCCVVLLLWLLLLLCCVVYCDVFGLLLCTFVVLLYIYVLCGAFKSYCTVLYCAVLWCIALGCGALTR